MPSIPTVMVTLKGEKGSTPRLINESDYDPKLHIKAGAKARKPKGAASKPAQE